MAADPSWRTLARLLPAVAGLALACAVPSSVLAADPPEDDPSLDAPASPQNPAAASDVFTSRGSVRRIATIFDFEEPGNPHLVPLHWAQPQDTERHPRPGFPRFNVAEFDFQISHAGRASVKLSTRGGSTALRLGAGVIPVFADGDYALNAWVRTDGLTEARAFVTARLLDQTGAVIAESEVRSDPIFTRGEWTEVSLQLIGVPRNAAFLQIELSLLQPRQFRPDPPEGSTQVRAEDLSGAAWFDDIVVSQLPRVELTTGAPSNIVLRPDVPKLKLLVRDFVGESLVGHLVVTDVDDKVLVDRIMPLEISGRPQEITPELSGLGWYQATLGVYGRKPNGEPYQVGGTRLAFLWLGEDAGSAAPDAGGPRAASDWNGGTAARAADRARFGIIADRAPFAELTELPSVARRTGTGFVTIPVWDEHSAPGEETAHAATSRLGQHVDALSKAGQQIIVCIPSVPSTLVAEHQLSPEDPLGLAGVDPAKWMPIFLPVLDRYGQRLTRWQIGCAGIDAAFWRSDAAASLGVFRKQLSTLVPGPALGVPWRAELALPPGLTNDSGDGGMLVMSYPAAFGSRSLEAVLGPEIRKGATGGEKGSDRRQLIFLPELPDARTFGERAAVVEFARRTIEFWNLRTRDVAPGSLASVALSHPWDRASGPRAEFMPHASLGAMRTLIEHLSDRRVIGEYDVAPGVRCLILADLAPAADGSTTGALVAWAESASTAGTRLERYLGPGRVVAVDIFGNRTAVARSETAGGPHVVSLGETPVFIEGIDPMLARFCGEVRADPSFLPAVQTEHELSLVLTNPWPHAVSGKLQIVPPSGQEGRRRWSVTPDGIMSFSLGAGQTKRIPWQVAFPYFEETGDKKFSVVVRLTTDRELPPIVLPLSLQVGLQDLGLEPELQVGPKLDGPDVIITATVSNRSARSRMLKLEAVAPGLPTQQTLISELPGGEAVIKRIVFKNAAESLAGKRIWLSLSDSDDQERLNSSVSVP